MMISYLKTNYRTKVLINIDFCAIIFIFYSSFTKYLCSMVVESCECHVELPF